MPSGTACAAKFKSCQFERQEEYDEFLAQRMEDEKPVGLAEIHLVRKAQHTWLANRALHGPGDKPTRRRNASVK